MKVNERKKGGIRKENPQETERKFKIILKKVDLNELIGPTSTLSQKTHELRNIPSKLLEKTKITMADHLSRVGPLVMNGNLCENWRKFNRNFEIYMRAGELMTKSNAIKVNTFLNAIGEEAVEIFDTLALTDEERSQYDSVVKAFADFCTPKKNPVYERFMFYQRKQKDGEPFDSFLIEIKRLVRTCEFNDRETEMLRDQIVMGTNDSKLQTRLLEIATLTYDAAVEKCRANEATREQSSVMNKTVAVNEVKIHAVGENTQHRSKNYNERNNNNNNGGAHNKFNGKKQQYRQNFSNNTNTKRNQWNNSNLKNDNANKNIINCKFCNFTHKVRECPAYGKTCNACFKKNHFSSVCRTRNVSLINVENDSNDNNDFYIGSVESGTSNAGGNLWLETLRVLNFAVAFKIDTGAAIDVLPLIVLMRFGLRIELQPTSITLTAFGGQKFKPLGMCSLTTVFNGVSLMVNYAVVDFDCVPILGLQSCILFGIVEPLRSRIVPRAINNGRNL